MIRRLRYPDLWQGCVLATCADKDNSRSKLVTDFSGHGNHGAMSALTATIASRYAPSQYGVVYQFYGAEQSSYGRCPELEATSNFTASFWAKRSAVGDTVMAMSKRFNTNDLTQTSFNTTGMLRMVPKVSTIYGEYASNDTEWHHACWLFDGTQPTNATRLRLVLDGTEVALAYVGTIGTTTTTTTNGVNVGSNTVSYTTGYQADLRIYNRTLSLGEARLLSTSPTVAYETLIERRGKIPPPPTFRAAWMSQRSQIIGGGVR